MDDSESVISVYTATAAAADPPPIVEKGTQESEESEDSIEEMEEAAIAPKKAGSRKRCILVLVLLFLILTVGVLLFLHLDPFNVVEFTLFTREAVVTAAPTTLSPTSTPTQTPTTLMPSSSPSDSPSVSASPSLEPTPIPTISPSNFPTIEPLPFIPVNPVPNPRYRGYFNYNDDDRQYGPEFWRRINMDGTYFREFGQNGFGAWRGHFDNHLADSTNNLCSVTGKQSPVDLRDTGGEGGKCTASHQIRSRAGSHRLFSPEIEKRIEPNKLRLEFPRRPCLNLEDDACWKGRPPMADFPNWSSSETHFSDLINLDIKVPGEHTINGEEFDAEMQLLHLHLVHSRFGYIGVPIRARVAGFNRDYQDLLDQFQYVFNVDKSECDNRRRGLRQQRPVLNQTESILAMSDDPDEAARRLQSQGNFDPYNTLLKTVYFYRYHGSNTEPPCFPITWFVLTKPLVISFEQLRQTKSLIFTHVDGDCQKTSVHNKDQSVARPIQRLANDPATQQPRPIMFCEEDDFDPDR